jgi:hypothetical protein
VTCESSDFKSSAYNLISQFVGHFGTGLHSPREGKILEPLVKVALADISTLSATPFLTSFTVLALDRFANSDLCQIKKTKT